MPSTLAHFGVQGPLTRLWVREVDVRWVLLGCIVPDVPWIANRIIAPLDLMLPAYETRLYFMAQASLFCSLLLGAALASVSVRFRAVFGVLAAQATLHLLLDASEAKWGNGVHLLVPLYWEQINLGWFWPESPVTYVLVLLGVLFVAREWMWGGGRAVPLGMRKPVRIATALALLSAYALLPLAFMDGLEASDSHSIRTLRERDLRPGRVAAFDRVVYSAGEESGQLRTFDDEEIALVGRLRPDTGAASVRGVFVSPDTLRVTDMWVHRVNWRDYSSYGGLALLVLFWVFPPRARKRN